MTRKHFTLLGVSLLLGISISSLSIANNTTLESLLDKGKSRQALRLAEKMTRSDNVSLDTRFLLARSQVATGKLNRAEQTYQQLISEAPGQPEPYVNLAKIYVDSGRIKQARALLIQSMNAHPGYSLVYQNLVDIHSMMASKAYRSALLLESTTSRPNLHIAKTLSPVNIYSPVLVARKQSDKIVAMEKPIASQKQTSKKTTSVGLSTVTISVPQLNDDETRQILKKSTLGWAKAWSDRNVPGYLSYYDNHYVPADSGISRKGWELQRKARIAGKRFIKIKATEIDVQVNGDEAVVELTQSYRSDTFHDTVRKKLRYRQGSEGWKIVGEVIVK